MSNMLRRALSVHRDRIKSAAAEECVYVRSRFNIKVTCIPGGNLGAEADNEYEGRADIQIADFLLWIDELKIGDQMIEPQRGDQIIWDDKLYDIVPGVAGTSWRWSDVRETWYRVHTDFRKHYVSS